MEDQSHFPWRCNMLHFWEAELRDGGDAGGAGEGGAVLGGWDPNPGTPARLEPEYRTTNPDDSRFCQFPKNKIDVYLTI